jgi:hypothetical protein
VKPGDKVKMAVSTSPPSPPRISSYGRTCRAAVVRTHRAPGSSRRTRARTRIRITVSRPAS